VSCDSISACDVVLLVGYDVRYLLAQGPGVPSLANKYNANRADNNRCEVLCIVNMAQIVHSFQPTRIDFLLFMWAVLFRMRLVLTFTFDMLRPDLTQATTMLALRDWPTLFVHMNQWTVYMSYGQYIQVLGYSLAEVAGYPETDLDGGKSSLDDLLRKPHMQTFHRLSACWLKLA
jgi:hypothetical protein